MKSAIIKLDKTGGIHHESERRKISTNAKLIKKNQQTFEDLASGKGIPIPKELYELVFETKDGTISFTVSEYEYHVVNEKMKHNLPIFLINIIMN